MVSYTFPVMEITSRKQHLSRASHCPCCGRETTLTFHHLIPKKLHWRTRFRQDFTREELNCGIEVCRECHRG